jgi:uncharacterized protein YaeQ
MSFVAAFYNFTIELSHVDEGIFTRFRVKTALHPHEPLEHLYARVLAYAHAFKPDQVFSQGFFDLKEPTIWEKDILGEVLSWVYVGVPESKVLEAALRTCPLASFRIYFHQDDQVDRLCSLMKSSRSAWLSRIVFYRFQESFLQNLVPFDSSSPVWTLTFVDDGVYLACGEQEFESSVTLLDMSREFQRWLQSQDATPDLP